MVQCALFLIGRSYGRWFGAWLLLRVISTQVCGYQRQTAGGSPAMGYPQRVLTVVIV